MALGRMNPAYTHAPEILIATGYATFPVTPPGTPNYVIPQQRYTPTANAAGAVIGQALTLGPDTRVPVVQYPTPAYAPTVATGGTTSTLMLDLRAFPSDIINVDATFVSASPSAGAINGVAYGNLYILGIDNVNKFAYFVALTSGGANLNFAAGMGIQWTVCFKDLPVI